MFLVAQISKAQSPYQFILKGQKSVYDTGVVIRIDVYRMETKKLKYGSQLIDSLVKLYSNTVVEYKLKDSVSSIRKSENLRLQKEIKVKDSLNNQLYQSSQQYNKLAVNLALNRPKKWVENPWTWLLATAFAVTIIKN